MSKLKSCPICNRPVIVNGGSEQWTPTFYDPDSGGEPYSISCECGLYFCIGNCDYSEFEKAWNSYQSNEEKLKIAWEEFTEALKTEKPFCYVYKFMIWILDQLKKRLG